MSIVISNAAAKALTHDHRSDPPAAVRAAPLPYYRVRALVEGSRRRDVTPLPLSRKQALDCFAVTLARGNIRRAYVEEVQPDGGHREIAAYDVEGVFGGEGR